MNAHQMLRDAVPAGTQNGALDVDWIVKEIQLMMHGMGDCPTPLLSTAQLIEGILLRQLRSATLQAAEACAMRGDDVVKPQDFIFLMRRNKTKLARMHKFIEFRDLRIDRRQGDVSTYHSAVLKAASIRHSRPDPVQLRRLQRADEVSRLLDPTRYIEYVRARRASFCVPRDKVPRLLEATVGPLKADAPKVTALAAELLGYLAYETVAQLVDLAFEVRQDMSATISDPFARYSGAALAHPSAGIGHVGAAPPISVAEVTEAMRRYFSQRFNLLGGSTNTHHRLLAC